MKKTQFVKYDVTMKKNIGTQEEPMWVKVRATGVVKDTCDKIGAIFRQNPRFLSCTRLVREDYYPIYC